MNANANPTTPSLADLNVVTRAMFDRSVAAYEAQNGERCPLVYSPYVLVEQSGYSRRGGAKVHVGYGNGNGAGTACCHYHNGRPLRGVVVEAGDLGVVTCKRCLKNIEKLLTGAK